MTSTSFRGEARADENFFSLYSFMRELYGFLFLGECMHAPVREHQAFKIDIPGTSYERPQTTGSKQGRIYDRAQNETIEGVRRSR